jgi:hypothetical protein
VGVGREYGLDTEEHRPWEWEGNMDLDMEEHKPWEWKGNMDFEKLDSLRRSVGAIHNKI